LGGRADGGGASSFRLDDPGSALAGSLAAGPALPGRAGGANSSWVDLRSWPKGLVLISDEQADRLPTVINGTQETEKKIGTGDGVGGRGQGQKQPVSRCCRSAAFPRPRAAALLGVRYPLRRDSLVSIVRPGQEGKKSPCPGARPREAELKGKLWVSRLSKHFVKTIRACVIETGCSEKTSMRASPDDILEPGMRTRRSRKWTGAVFTHGRSSPRRRRGKLLYAGFDSRGTHHRLSGRPWP